MSADPLTVIQNRLDDEAIPIQWLANMNPILSGLWRIKDLFPAIGLVCTYGASSSGKTFLIVDIVCHIAAGLNWGERRTKQGVVIYIAAEAPSSLINRLTLWRDLRAGGADVPLGVFPRTFNLRDPNADLPLLTQWLSTIVSERGPIAAIVVDTLARVMGGGDENATQDMGALISTCDQIRDRFQTLVVLVHHAGKDLSAGARGSSSLRAGVDTEIEVTANGEWHKATWKKQRDGIDGFAYEFKLSPHVIGKDEEGEAVTTCVIDELRFVGEDKPRQKKLTNPERIALDAMHHLLDSATRIASADAMQHGARSLQTIVDKNALRQLCYQRDISDSGSDAKKKAFDRAMKGLQAKRKVNAFGDELWLAD